jgi:hypothetical protein
MLGRIRSLVLVVLLAAAFALAQNPAPAPAGNWKVILVVPGEENHPSWIVRFEKPGDTWSGSVLATAEGVQAAKMEGVKLDGMTLSFALKMPNFTLPVQVKLPTDKELRMVGEATVRDKKNPIILEPTKLTSLDDFARAEEVLARPENTRATYKAALTLIALAGERRAKVETVKSWAERAAKAAEGFGKDQCEALRTLAEYLAEQEANATLAIPYATRAEELVAPEDPPVVRKRILRVLARALERAGKEEEAKAVRARNDKIELIRLRPYMGKAKGAVLVETFSCAQQATCLGPDLACEALPKTYTGDTQVFVLNHHLSVPGPDPLTNPATEERERYYRPRGTPAIYLNGKPGPAGGGSVDEAQAKYDAYVAAITPLLEKVAPRPTLEIKATRKGDFVEIEWTVRDLAMPGEDIRLRLVLLEDAVEYTGANGLPRHTSVVRDYLGTAAGLALPEKSYTRTVNVNVADLRQRLRAYLEKANEATAFPSKIWPTELKKLRVVGFVQNDKTRDVLTVAGVEVKAVE